MMDFIQLIHDNLTGTDPRPIVHEVDADIGISDLDRPAFAALIARIRGGLRARSLHAGDRVVLLGANGVFWTASDLAILQEGAICVPLYPRQHIDELRAMMIDCAPTLVVVLTPELGATVQGVWPEAPIVLLAELAESIPFVGPPHERTPDDVVTIVYTSGTSGEAKGVMITVANIDHMLAVTSSALVTLMGEEAGTENVYHYLPCCFMGSRVVLWTCLFREIPILLSTNLERILDEVAMAEPDYFLNVPVLLERVKNGAETAITGRGPIASFVYHRVKAAWLRRSQGKRPGWFDARWLSMGDERIFAGIRARFGPNLRFLICGSAPLGEDTQQWFEMVGVPVYQVYGLTETTAIVTMDQADIVRAGWVGLPIAGNEVSLTDEGELLVAGPHIFSGYWDRPEATAEVLQDGWFHTGDLVEQDEAGRLRIIGRAKNLLVPTSGHNVAPEPLEQKLVETIPGAEQVVVMGHGRPHLVALVAGPARHGDIQAAIDALNADLPHYRRIRAFCTHPTPLTDAEGYLTANGKLKRAAIEQGFESLIAPLYR